MCSLYATVSGADSEPFPIAIIYNCTWSIVHDIENAKKNVLPFCGKLYYTNKKALNGEEIGGLRNQTECVIVSTIVWYLKLR